MGSNFTFHPLFIKFTVKSSFLQVMNNAKVKLKYYFCLSIFHMSVCPFVCPESCKINLKCDKNTFRVILLPLGKAKLTQVLYSITLLSFIMLIDPDAHLDQCLWGQPRYINSILEPHGQYSKISVRRLPQEAKPSYRVYKH